MTDVREHRIYRTKIDPVIVRRNGHPGPWLDPRVFANREEAEAAAREIRNAGEVSRAFVLLVPPTSMLGRTG